MKYRVTAGAGLLALVAAAVFVLVGGTDGGQPSGSAGTTTGRPTATVLVAPPSPADEKPAGAVRAAHRPAGSAGNLVLTAPAQVQPGHQATFGGRWSSGDGERVDGAVDLQRIDDNSWSTVTSMQFEDGVGEVAAQVNGSGVYRLAYGGSDKVGAAVSAVRVVLTGETLDSRITATAESAEDGTVSVTAAWTTTGGVPITGDLVLQQEADEGWKKVTTVTTNRKGTAVAEVEAQDTARFRFSYPGGDRFGPVVSDPAVALGDDVRTIPVDVCDDSGDLDVLPNGVGCHYQPVSAGTFVAAHDYLGNAWWNSIPIGSYVELTGELPGLYEVVDRVIAPARGAALGPASDWTCGSSCDVILQTCQGKNTGFTWLRRVGDGPEDLAQQ